MTSDSLRLAPRDLWLLALLTLSWGVNWPIMKAGIADFAPLTFRVISMFIGLFVLYGLVRSQGLSLTIPRQHWRELFFLGLFNMVIWFTLSIYAVKMLSSGRAAILGYTLPIWSALWGIAIFGEKPSGRLVFGLVSAMAGVALLLAGEFGTLTGRPLGTVLMLVAAFFWALGTHLMRRRKLRASVLVISFWTILQSLIACGLIALVVEREQWTHWPDARTWWAILYNAFVIFGFSQVMWFRLATILPPVASGLSVMLIPVTGVFSGMLLLGEQPGWRDYVALGCVLVAIATILLPSRRP